MANRNSRSKKKKEEASYTACRYRAYPTEEQLAYFVKVWGCCRFMWNQYVADNRDFYKIMGKKLNNSPADYKDDFPFLKEVDNYALLNTVIHYDEAMSAFFSGDSEYPKFKKKGKCQESYTTNFSHGNIVLYGDLLKVPKLPGRLLRLNVHRPVPEDGILKSVTISREPDGSIYVSILYEKAAKTTQLPVSIEDLKFIGLDMVMQGLYLSSDGECGDYPRFYRQMEEKLAKEQHKLSGMVKGSKNYEAQKEKIAAIHAKIKHQRWDFLHKLSYHLVMRYDVICVEDLDMHAMAQSLKLGKSVCDNGWGMFCQMLEYKCREHGKRFIKVDKWYASSQNCHQCGYKNKAVKDLSIRKWVCPQCGTFHDRDLNAAINIREEGKRMLKEMLEAAVA